MTVIIKGDFKTEVKILLFTSDTLKKNQNNMIFKSILIIFTATIFTGIFSSDVLAAEGPEVRGNPNRLAKIKIADTGQFDGNRIRNDLENNGMIVSHRITGHSGMEWPKDSNLHINFASGIWIAGLVNGDLRIAVSEYGPEFVPGPYGSDPDDPAYRIYKLSYLNPHSEDYTEWPVEQGAPWIDANGDGVYNVEDGDKPDMLGDQMLWYVMNDGDVAEHGNIFGTLPLGVEVQITIWGYVRASVVGDMMFVKILIINKGEDTIDSTFITLWDDPDLGNAGDDFVGCDTTLSLGFCYNDGADHDYGSDPPAIGYDFFQGPIVPSPGDTAFAFGGYIPNFKNLPMTSFIKYIGTSDPNWSDPSNARDAYNLMQGLHKNGDPFINSETGVSTKFVYADDPNDNTGAGDGVWVDSDDHASGDRRFMMNSGPFTMAPGDSQEVVFGIIIARGTDALNSVTVLKEVDVMAQSAFDLGFKMPKPEFISNVAVTALEDAIILNWDDGFNAIEQFTEEALFEKDSLGQKAWYRFQGYNVYQLETAYGQGDIKRLATYDIIDGVTEIWDDIYDPDYGSVVNVRVQYGYDSGVKRSIVIDRDALRNDIPLKTNRVYYFAVTAYGYNPNGEPKTVESEMKIIEVRPQVSTAQIVSEEIQPGITSIPIIHISGNSDGLVKAVVIDPLAVTGDNYEVTFRWNADSSSIIWDLTNTTTNTMLVSGNPIQGGVDLESGDVVGVEASPIVEGIQVMVSGPALDFKNFQVVANAAGAIDPPEGAAADFQGFPTLRPTDGQQVGGGHWMFHTGGGGRSSYETFLARSMRGSNFDRLVPYDWEMRFTAEGSYAVRAFEDGLIVSVPFELWNVGIATYDDPSDDYRLIPWFLSLAGLGENDLDDFVYQVEANDHATSGGSNDPYTDWIYWRIPEDNSAGTAGYDAFVASIDFTTDPPNEGSYAYDGAEVIARSVLVNWNGGDVEDPTWPANVNQLVPEEGTIFRLISTKPNAIVDVFTFSTSTFKTGIVVYDPENINVWPNPYFAYNPEERTPFERKVMFTHLPGIATIRIFNLAGELVRIIRHTDGTQFETWDLTNMVGRSVGSGMYIVYIETEFGAMVLKLAVIQPQERLHIY